MHFGRISTIIFPEKADNSVFGHKITVYVFFGIAILSTIRSLIHVFSSDGGAGSIAGMDLTLEGAKGIIFAFGLWGSSQLLFAGIQWLILLRYRALIPIMYVFIILEILLRMLIGTIKPVSFAGTPPGVIGNLVLLPLAFIMLFLCFVEKKTIKLLKIT